MSRKIFISVLGTGFYGECQYAKGEFLSTPTRFVQQAMMEYHDVKLWNEEDRAYVLLTEKARKDNWDIPSGKRLNEKKKEKEDYQGLKQILADIPTVEGVPIPDGKDEGEMWQIFSTIYNLLREGDELYIDLTHSFRYLPMLVLVLTNYAHFLKNIEVKAVSYGNFEARDKTTGIAPIVDLLPLVALQRWTFAAADFIKNGDTKQLLELSKPQLSRRLSESEGKDEVAKSLNGFIRQLEAFTNEVRLCRGVSTYDGDSFKKMMELAPQTTDFIKPLTPILKNILESVTDFSTSKDVRNCFAAAKWCFSKGLYQSAVTELQEGIVSFFCVLHSIPIDDHSQREIVNRAFKKKLNPQAYSSSSKEFEDKVNEIVQDKYLSSTLVDAFADLTDIRNDYNHAGMRNDKSYPKRKPRTAAKLAASIKKHIDSLVPLFCEGLPAMPSVFINLSNHPSATWSDEQRAAAETYGDIEDMPFPPVDPEADEEAIEQLAQDIVEQIVKKSHDHRVTVHVMGEMCLTFAIVRRLQAYGIPCISSTTHRIVEELPDGTKHAEFHFKRFRSYGEK